MNLKGKHKAIITAGIVILIVVLFFTFCVRIKHIRPGYVGVQSDIGGVLNDSTSYNIHIVKGYVIYLPLLSEVYTYPTTINNVTIDSFKAFSKEGTEFLVSPVISYQVDDNRADVLYQNYKKSLNALNSTDIKLEVQKAYNDIFSGYTNDSLLNNRHTVDSLISNRLAVQLNKMGLLFNKINSNIEIPQSLKDILELRARSVQNVLVRKEQVNETDFIRQIDSLRYSALTNLAVQKMFIDKWDGKLGSNDIPMIYKEITKDLKTDKKTSEKD
jgi:hypothetical protein